MARKKKTIITDVTREHADEAFATYAKNEAHGTIGFRTGTPKLKLLRGFTWISALPLVKEFLPDYVRQSEEVAKDKLLADRDADVMTAGDPLGPGTPMKEQMAKCGIQVVQEEAFFVEPKKEETA